ncbi:MAG: toxin TcdB middle/N-terminal domain-containing protein, partial [Armatimonadota bacterium]
MEFAGQEKGEAPQDAEAQSLPSGFSGKSGVTPQSLALPDGSGSIGGMGESFTPNMNTGSGSMSIPITLPPGRRGLQPSVGLGYSTGGGDGPLGWGWSMEMPFISRQSDKGLPRYDHTDRFMYNGGQELVPVAMPEDEQWPHGWDPDDTGHEIIYYRARAEGAFMRFFYDVTGDTWLVQDRQGNHFYIGENETEKIVGPDGTYKWMLSRTADVRRALGLGGNDVQYTYFEDGGALFPQSIYWNSFGQSYGDPASYQHEVRFVWEPRPDATVSYAAGFAVESNLRLERIEVRSYQYSPTSGDRSLTRAYLFSYEDQTVSFHSRLVGVQTCGRDYDASSNTGSCMPPIEFQYSVIEDMLGGGDPIPGFGQMNRLVQELNISPDVAADDANVDLMDVNHDGLPDVFITKPDYNGFGNDHAAILNDGLGNLDPEAAVRVDNPAGWSLNLENMNVSVLDMDGAGNADLLHMPYAEQYHFYRMSDVCDGAEYCWNETESIPLNDAIDFTADAEDIRLADINNDHLVDVVRTTGTRMEHFLNLSAFPGFEGEFGRIDEAGDPVANESINTCLLYRGGTMQFHDGNLQFADMNGDGLLDIVDMKNGSIAYWPGRGWGRWGDTEEVCAPGEIVDGIEIEMAGSPWFSNPDNEGVLVADVNGDGLSDLVQIRFDAVDIWLNKDGRSFTSRHIIDDTPHTNSGSYGKVRLADINGSGTTDIVWADAGGWKYIDLGGDYRLQGTNRGLPAGLLERTTNGMGGENLIEYDVTTRLMVDARGTVDEWRTVAPMPMTVVRKIVARDNLDVLGGPAGRYVQEFVYRDPYYDPHEAEFKGFGYSEAWDRERTADMCSAESIARGEAPTVTRNWYHRGARLECMEHPDNESWPAEWGPNTVACKLAIHEDSPALGLTGASVRSEVYSPCWDTVISATASRVRIRKLFDNDSGYAWDNRSVYFISADTGLVYKYDPNPATGNQDQEGVVESISSVTFDPGMVADLGLPVSTIETNYVTASPLGSFHRVDGFAEIDDHGYPVSTYYGGFHDYGGGHDLYEHARCDEYTEVFETAFNPVTWVHASTRAYMLGPSDSSCIRSQCTSDHPCNDLTKHYVPDDVSDCTATDERHLCTIGDLEYSVVSRHDYDGTAEAPFEAVRKEYNGFGQVTHEYAGCTGPAPEGCERHTRNVYTDEDDGDLHYSAYIRQEIAHVPDSLVGTFVSKARWDAGLAQVVFMRSADGSEGAVEFDELGRFVRAYGANPETGELCPSPSKEVFYHYGDAGMPMSMLETWVNTSRDVCGSDRWETILTFVTALGREYAAVAPGDKHLGEEAAYPWVINGAAAINSKGNAYRTCEGGAIAAPLLDPFDVVAKVESLDELNCSTQVFDEFNRPTLSIAPDGTRAYAEYGIDIGYSYDHLDLPAELLPPGETEDAYNVGTYSSQRVDGLGRTVETVVRHRDPDTNELRERWVTAEHGDIGGPVVVSEFEISAGANPSTATDRVSRRAAYDSLGRMRVNMDLHSGRWEYRYDSLGQLVETENPLGQVAEYYYDKAGRLIAEFYEGSDTPESVYYYDAVPDDATLWGDDVPETWPGYPSYAVTMGRLVAVVDRAGVTVSAGNHGTFSETWRMVRPDPRLYHFETLVDGAGQLVYAEDPDGHRSTADYYADGTFKSSYWTDDPGEPFKHQIVREIRNNIVGQTEWVEYGDGGDTVAWTGYDPVNHQTDNVVVQQLHGGSTADTTLLAFGYEYDRVGKLTGVADWRGRGPSSSPRINDLTAPHPASNPALVPLTAGNQRRVRRRVRRSQIVDPRRRAGASPAPVRHAG